MKTVPKILLLLFGLAQLFIVLYFCIPTIPTKIKNETPGTQYTFDKISFNLISDNLKTPDEDTQTKLDEREYGDALVLFKDNKDGIGIWKANQKEIDLVNEDLNNFKNPFKHRTWEKSMLQKFNTGNKDGIETLSYSINLFVGENKTILLTNYQLSDAPYTNIMNIKLEDEYYTVFFTGSSWITNGDIAEFMRTVSLAN